MSIHNSHNSRSEDESDITIINPSMVDENDEYRNDTYVPIITRLQQANHSSENRQTSTTLEATNDYSGADEPNSFIFVHHDPLENAKKLERVLKDYSRDLKQESNSQISCDKQLVTRLMDLIRPAYTNDEKKQSELDRVTADIGSLHDKRHVEQEEKTEQLRTEICRLNKMLFTASNDHSLYDERTTNHSIYNTMQQRSSVNDFNQWTEIEDDAKKLHELVQTQKNQINEIVSLISQTASASTGIDSPNTPTNNAENPVAEKQSTPPAHTDMISTLLQKISRITGQQPQSVPEPIPVTPKPNATLVNHSPGASPSESLNTLVLHSTTPSINQPENELEKSIDKQEPVIEPPREQPKPVVEPPKPEEEVPDEPVDIPVSPAPESESKYCPVCNHEFPETMDAVEMYDHIEKCLFPPNLHTEPKDYECPYCNRKYSGKDEADYLQHVTDCCNRDI